MLKTRESSVASIADGTVDLTGEPKETEGVVHWFMDPEELHRQLSMMAGAELVGALLGDL
jgi:hypothetical protein